MARQAPSRRLMYPENSVPYTVYLEPDDPDEIFQKLDKPETVELKPKPTFLKVGPVSQVKGSAYLEYGKTKVMATVHPPREISKHSIKGDLGKVVCHVKYAPFANNDCSINIPRRENFLSVALRKALQPIVCRHEFPNFQLDIKVLVIDDDGCVLSTAINCCGAALAEGGISTFDLVTASTVCFYRGVEFISPNSVVEKLFSSIKGQYAEEEHGLVVIASQSDGQITECLQLGFLSPKRMQELSDHTLALNQEILNIVQHVLITKVKKYIKETADK